MPRLLLIAAMMLLSTSMLYRSALSAGSTGGAIPLYPGMQSRGDATTQGGIAGERYCSNASAASIRNFYKNHYEDAFEVEKGTTGGVAYLILFDVASPAPYSATGREEGRYAINLLSTKEPIDRASLPSLPVLTRFKLYTTRAKKDDMAWHRLRLGFFSTLEEAEKTFATIRGHFPDGWVTKVSQRERDRVGYTKAPLVKKPSLLSPAEWHLSKQFIEITENKSVSGCPTTVFITRERKIVEKKRGIDYLPEGLPVSKLEAPSAKVKPLPVKEDSEHKEPEKAVDKIVPHKRKDELQRNYFGIGGFANTFNTSGGPSLQFWPLRNIGIQGTYGFGTLTSYEVRGMYRFNIPGRLKPYIGAGYIHTERDATIIGVDTTIEDDGVTLFGGAEVAFHKNIFLYVDVSANDIELETTVTSGGSTVRATVEYSPITIGVGLILYLF